MTFHAASGLDAPVLAGVQALVRQRILSTFIRRGLIDKNDADVMGGWEHGGDFSMDASVCIKGADRTGLERLLRYCARPPFTLEHLQHLDAEHLVYLSPMPLLDGSSDLVLTPLELIDKIVALVPPLRAHRHRYYSVLAPNSSLRAAVTAMAPVPVIAPPLAVAANTNDEPRHRAALPVDDVAGANLRCLPVGLPELPRTDADHRLH